MELENMLKKLIKNSKPLKAILKFIKKNKIKKMTGSKTKGGNRYLTEKERNIGIKGTVLITKKRNGKIMEVKRFTNLITNLGLQNICKALIDNAGFTEGITYLALGDDDTAAALGDTALGNETFRKQLTTRDRIGQQIILSAYLATSEANDTHYELGLFGNGATITTDSGDLFNHLIMSGGEVKDSSESWTIDITIELTNG